MSVRITALKDSPVYDVAKMPRQGLDVPMCLECLPNGPQWPEQLDQTPADQHTRACSTLPISGAAVLRSSIVHVHVVETDWEAGALLHVCTFWPSTQWQTSAMQSRDCCHAPAMHASSTELTRRVQKVMRVHTGRQLDNRTSLLSRHGSKGRMSRALVHGCEYAGHRSSHRHT